VIGKIITRGSWQWYTQSAGGDQIFLPIWEVSHKTLGLSKVGPLKNILNIVKTFKYSFKKKFK
jgi:hypothetical protein